MKGTSLIQFLHQKKKKTCPHAHCQGQFFVHGHVSSIEDLTLLNPDLFWGVQSETRHWAA